MPHESTFSDTSSTILLVDDNVENLDILVNLLSDYDVRDVIDGESALEVVRQEKIDLILLDIMMPGMDGYEACRRLKSDPLTEKIPVIFITSKGDGESIDKAYQISGNDYITKPFRAKELLARVNVQLELKNLFNELTYLAYHDSLTGILNRRRFFELGNEAFARSENIAAVMIDIDSFKSINDKHGHAAGDEIIKMVTHTIAMAIPDGVLFGRLGGEEFILICESYSYEGAKIWIDFIRKQIENNQIEFDGKTLSCTISSGVADKTAQMKSLEELIMEADRALYQAKGLGKNQTVFYIQNKQF